MASHIKEALNRFLAQKQGELKQQETVRAVAERAAGKECLGKDHDLAVRKNILTIRCPDPATRYLLELKKEKIDQEIKKAFPDITGIKITL